MGSSASKNTIKNNYNALFDLKDKKDVEWSKRIRKIPTEKMKEHLIETLKVIDRQDWTIDEWSEFKYELLADGKKFNFGIFKDWGIPGAIYPLITLNWKMIGRSTTAMFCVSIMFENFYDQKERLPSVWNLSVKTTSLES